MLVTRMVVLGHSLLALGVAWMSAGAQATPASHPIVRLAELEIEPAQLSPYLAALKEEIATSIRVEPGVLTLYAVAVKGRPGQIRLFEMYADQRAYEAHVASPHFRKYKSATRAMVKSLKLLETEPILLGAKAK